MIAAIGINVASTLLGAKSAREQGEAARKAAEYEAVQLERRAEQEEESGSREAIEIRRQGGVLKSDTKAAMVASGGVTDDAGAIKTLSDIHGVVNYNALSAIFMGKQLAAESRASAETVRAGGRAAESTGRSAANATLLRGATSVASDYYDYKKGDK